MADHHFVTQITNTEITDNSAVPLATLEMGLRNDPVFGRAIESTKVMIGRDVDSPEEFLNRCGEGGGGGICLVLSDVPRRAVAQVTVVGSSIERNGALNGGRFLKDGAKIGIRETCGSCSWLELTDKRSDFLEG